jgi:hypothetical protein
MWCGLGNKQKGEGKYRDALEKKLCFIRKILVFGTTYEQEKGMRKPQKTLTYW